MPVKIPRALPAVDALTKENIFIMDEARALKQDIRALSIIILNLMPNKIDTEIQLLRLISNTPLQVEITFLSPTTHKPKNADLRHLANFYSDFDKVKNRKFDGMLITGAPLGLMDYEQVDYWQEFTDIVKWSRTNVYSTFYLCWAAHAGLYYNYGIPKYPLPKKLFGVFSHEVNIPYAKLTRGFDDIFMVPHSRHSEVKVADIEKIYGLDILASSVIAGAYLIATPNGREVYITGHSEYDFDTLKNEYKRDVDRGIAVDIPQNYFPDNDVNKSPLVSWRSHASLLFSNWLDYCVYQETPYEITAIG